MAGVKSISITYQELFFALVKVLPKIGYDPAWANNTGYFDYAAKQPVTMPMVSVDPHGRNIILMPDDTNTGGCYVVFQRHGPGKGMDSRFVRLCIHAPVLRKSGDISSGGETLVDDLEDLSDEAADRQLRVRMALLHTAIAHLHNK